MAKPRFVRPRTPLALEMKPRVRVSARLPAVVASRVRTTLPVVPARRLPGVEAERLERVTPAVTSRLSW